MTGRDAVVIVCQGLAGFALDDQPQPMIVGQYLAAYDPEAHDGYGEAEWTSDRTLAKVFTGLREAHAYWSQTPKCRPTRPDGEPNRPLCAFSVEFRSADPDAPKAPPYGDD